MAEVESKGMINIPQLLKALELESTFHVGDLGCGTGGHFTLPIARHIEEGVVYAVDVQKEILQNLKNLCVEQGIYNIKPVWSDLEIYGATKIPEKSLDRALLLNILFQSKEPEKIIKEALRLLKIGGHLFIVDWKSSNFTIGPPEERRISTQEIEDIARKLNMEVLEVMEVGMYHYGILLKKLF